MDIISCLPIQDAGVIVFEFAFFLYIYISGLKSTQNHGEEKLKPLLTCQNS